MNSYLDEYTGINIGDELLLHELWADDLYTVADTTRNSQKQADGIRSFCLPNQMIVNCIKTKCMVFGTFDEFNLYFNDKPIDRVNIYKYLGNLFNEISRAGCDIFRDNAKYIASQGRKAMFNI